MCVSVEREKMKIKKGLGMVMSAVSLSMAICFLLLMSLIHTNIKLAKSKVLNFGSGHSGQNPV